MSPRGQPELTINTPNRKRIKKKIKNHIISADMGFFVLKEKKAVFLICFFFSNLCYQKFGEFFA
jgi:hypothetical protein